MVQIDKPRIRRFRFSLRTLLLIVAVVGCGFGWLGNKVRESQQQQIAAEAIRKLGGVVAYEHDVGLAPAPGPEWLLKIVGVDFLGTPHTVWFLRGQNADAGLINLQGLKLVKVLTADGTVLSDAGLASLQGLTQLTHLSLRDTQITDAGLIYLHTLPQLTHLALSRTKVTDAGLVNLHGLTQLESLYLSETQITDAGVHELTHILPKVSVSR
jgi:hypothetical protein